MLRRFSFLATAMVLLVAATSLIVSGCGGSGGGSGSAASQGAAGSGRLDLRVQMPEELNAQSSTQLLKVQLFPLPFHEGDVPTIDREFILEGQTTRVVVDGIPYGTYLLRVKLTTSEGGFLGFFEQEVTIGPGVTSSVTAILGPSPTPSPSPSASPSPSPSPSASPSPSPSPSPSASPSPTPSPSPSPTMGAEFEVNPTPTAFPAGSHDVAGIDDGRFAVVWGAQDVESVPQTFMRSYAADGSTLTGTRAITSFGPAATIVEIAAAADAQARLLVATSLEQVATRIGVEGGTSTVPSIELRFVNLASGAQLGTQVMSAGVVASAYTGLSAGLPPSNDGSLLGSFGYEDVSKGQFFFMGRVQVPPPTGTPSPLPSPTLLAASGGGDVAQNATGDLAATYEMSSKGDFLAQSVFTNNLGLHGFQGIGAIDALGTATPAVAVRGGRGVAVWTLSVTTPGGPRRHVVARRFSFTPGNPGDLTVLDADPLPVSDPSAVTGGESIPQVGMDASGNFLVTWLHVAPTEQHSILARRFDASGNSGSIFQVDDGSNLSQRPRLAIDSAGNAVVVWKRGDGTLVGRRIPAAFGAPPALAP